MKIQGSKRTITKVSETQQKISITVNTVGELRILLQEELVAVQFNQEETMAIYALLKELNPNEGFNYKAID